MTRVVTIAGQLRARRRDLGLTQADLADLAGCSERFVRAVEAGKPTIRLDKLIDALDVVGLDLVATLRSGS